MTIQHKIYKSKVNGRWYLHIKGRNNKTIVSSQPRGYARRRTAIQALQIIKESFWGDDNRL